MRHLSLIVLVVLSFAGPLRASDGAPAFRPYLGQLDAQTQEWFEAAFLVYRESFIKDDGRVYDPQNNGITHSESQGYGMMLALLGDDRPTFDRIWNFAKTRMRRPDGLFSWKYEPGRGITDRNNATDGELFMGTALALAAIRWNDPIYARDAEIIADTVGRKLILNYGGYTLLLPGEWARPTRHNPVAIVNMSYFIPITLQMFEGLAPQHPWETVYHDSLRILDDMIHPPSDWTAINSHGEPNPARGFKPKFSYDAVRIPMYLLQADMTHQKTSDILNTVWGNPRHGPVFEFRVSDFSKIDRFWGGSYELAHDLLYCRQTGTPAEPANIRMNFDNYFDASLHLMMIAALFANNPECFPATESQARRSR
ncbi:glycosyl hydrolase family 8 [Amorphus orientalis]|uniref:cellulase n=1 Tax=Amorphus orientalis TaxID=649198 RepID=A0AAE3VKL1_9HYPH|nr:glycosyl hydrolase family 8 [Amorphus orientalis]MDQ0314154.1 endoglucanase [Amorphus orientalis]